jgi:hypothetical protein
MAGFVPSAEFYAPDPNPDLVGTPYEGILIRQQVLGEYGMTDVPAMAPMITSTAVTSGEAGTAYTYQVSATGFPGPISYSLDTAPSGMTMDGSGLINWTPTSGGTYDVAVSASNSAGSTTQAFQVEVIQPIPGMTTPILDDFNRPNGNLGNNWLGEKSGYRVRDQQGRVFNGGAIYWRGANASASIYGVNQEAYVTLTRLATDTVEQNLLLKVQGSRTNPNWGNGVILVNYDVTSNSVVVATFLLSTLSWKNYDAIPATFQDGDQLGARVLATGEVLIFKNNQLIGTITLDAQDQAFFNSRGGRIGLWYLDASNARFDDFGGGTVAP